MGRAYSQDLRERVIAAVDSGTGAYAVASLFRVSVSYIYKVLGRRKRTGETRARLWAGGPKPKLAAHDGALRARVRSEPDAALAELQAWLVMEHGVKVSIGCLWKRLRQLGLTLKKVIAGRRARPRGYRQGPRRMACKPARSEPRTSCLHCRNLGEDQYGAALWAGAAGSAPRRSCAARPLDDDNIRCRASPR
jgi:transposase